MTNDPVVHSTFSVTSKQLCFGSLHNIWLGASTASQSFPVAQPQPDGTVISHAINYNVPAQDGTWNVFQLVASESNNTVAWFVAHMDVDPQQEIDKILRVSGSPYEPDHGNTVNNSATSQEGILVINRYDWSYYDERCLDEIGEGKEEGEDDVLANSNSLGLVDRSDAQEMVRHWKEQRPSERGSSDHGCWLYIPHGEYMFGRFGFDDAHTAARSFLFFSAYTEFTHSSFRGVQETFRKYMTPQERFEVKLSEGVDFSGIETLRDMVSSKTLLPPPESERLGPYHHNQYLLRERDIEALRLHSHNSAATRSNRPVNGFVDPWKQPLFHLINEMVLSYTEHFVLPRLDGANIISIAKSLFPDYDRAGRPISLDVDSYRHFTEPDKSPVPEFDMSYVRSRARGFLVSCCRDNPRVFQENILHGVCRVLVYMCTEILEMANSAAINERRNKILPCDIRLAILQDEEILRCVLFSRVFWEGKLETVC